MIVPMKKASVIVQSKDAQMTINELRKLGVMHVEYQRPPSGKDINTLQEDLALINEAIGIISQKELISDKTLKEKPSSDLRRTARHIIDIYKRIDQLKEFSHTLSQNISQWQNWGDFDPGSIHRLKEKGMYVGLYQIPKKELDKLPQDIAIKEIFSDGGISNCVLISKVKPEITFKELLLPKMGLQDMQNRLKENEAVLKSLNTQLQECVGYRLGLIKVKQLWEKELEFHQALKGMGEQGSLAYIVGYLPYDRVNALQDLAKKEKWGIVITEPSSQDNIPVLLRNSKLVSIINPLFKLMEVVPGYHELDVSPLFLLFLSLFFGMIISDAGYGAIYFFLTFLAQRKLGKKVNPVRNFDLNISKDDISNGVKDSKVFFLFYLFSSCAILWGLLTGTVFGQDWYQAKGFPALAPILNEAKFLMSFCFFLGALQLSLAHGWQAIIKLPSLKALADVGFICLLWAGFFLAKMFIVGDPFPFFGKWLIWLGILLIIFFSKPSKNIFKTVAKGMSVLALGLTGNFGDVVSYIRLFAVGLAGVAVSDSVNTLAVSVGSNIVVQVIILFLGHTINIMLGPISVLVHGVRLNVLEFSVLHGNITWSGLAYKPLEE